MNSSGIHPKGYTLLILLDEVEESTGIIAKTQDRVAADQLAQTNATVIEIGPMCWSEETEPRAQVGDKIIFRLYAGEIKTGADNKKYRIIDDRSLYAVRD
jgi:co-chaperonin GroES (HSP10)